MAADLRFFVGEWALQHNRPLLPLSRAKSHETSCSLVHEQVPLVDAQGRQYHSPHEKR